jgi:hypothetical protein
MKTIQLYILGKIRERLGFFFKNQIIMRYCDMIWEIGDLILIYDDDEFMIWLIGLCWFCEIFWIGLKKKKKRVKILKRERGVYNEMIFFWYDESTLSMMAIHFLLSQVFLFLFCLVFRVVFLCFSIAYLYA